MKIWTCFWPVFNQHNSFKFTGSSNKLLWICTCETAQGGRVQETFPCELDLLQVPLEDFQNRIINTGRQERKCDTKIQWAKRCKLRFFRAQGTAVFQWISVLLYINSIDDTKSACTWRQKFSNFNRCTSSTLRHIGFITILPLRHHIISIGL